jgi:glycosyltransferase involved in cell wall biosynthesis
MPSTQPARASPSTDLSDIEAVVNGIDACPLARTQVVGSRPGPGAPAGSVHRVLRIAYPLAGLRIGGAEMRVLSLVERLPRDRFEVHFLSLIGEGLLDERGRAAGAHIHHLGTGPLVGSPLPVRAVGRLGKLARYARMARTSQYDIIDAWLYPTDVFAALGRFVTRTPIVLSGRADLLPRQAFGLLSPAFDRITNRLVDAIVANSDAVAAANLGRAGVDASRLRVIHNGVEPVDPISQAERRRLRQELGADDADLLIGSVGRLSDVKRHTLLIDAFSDLVRTHSDVRLAIIGEGPARRALEQQVERLGLGSKLRLPGAITNIRPLFDAFDVVALSSSSEGMPNALLEAAAASRPIVTTAAGGAVEIVLDGKTGLVVPIEDRAALAGALQRVLSDEELRGRLGSAARAHVTRDFGIERFAREWIALYEELAVAKGLIPG